MSIAAIVATVTLAGTAAWFTSRWSGSHNLPTEAQVDRLVADAQRRRASGVHDHDDVMEGDLLNRMTYGEYLDAARMPDAVSEAAIAAASEDPTIAPFTNHGPALAWLSGGYAMPTFREVDAAAPHTTRGAYRGARGEVKPIPRHIAFGDESPLVVRLPNPTGLGADQS